MYVYETTNLVNGKKYIGVCVNSDEGKRRRYLGSGKLLKLAIKKYGKENFSKRILKEFDDKVSARAYERELIEELDAIDDPTYYNLVAGGFGGSIKGGKLTDETKKKISKALTGRKRSKETIKKVTEKLKGYEWTEEDIEKRRQGLIKYHQEMTDEAKAQRGLNISNGLKGKEVKDSTKIKLSKRSAKLSEDEVRTIFLDRDAGMSGKELSVKYGVGISSISEILNRKTYKWVEI